MITASTIIAVALGLTPVDGNSPSQVVSGDYRSTVGHYTQTVDRRGTIHVRGAHPRTGAPYEMTISNQGEVEANLGDSVVNFRVRPSR